MKQPEDIAAEEYFATRWEETVMSDEQSDELIDRNSAHPLGMWIKLVKEAQAKITWEARQKEVDEAEQRGFMEGHKMGRREGIDEGLQRAELFMQRNLPINPELNPKWQAFLKEVEKC